MSRRALFIFRNRFFYFLFYMAAAMPICTIGVNRYRNAASGACLRCDADGGIPTPEYNGGYAAALKNARDWVA